MTSVFGFDLTSEPSLPAAPLRRVLLWTPDEERRRDVAGVLGLTGHLVLALTTRIPSRLDGAVVDARSESRRALSMLHRIRHAMPHLTAVAIVAPGDEAVFREAKRLGAVALMPPFSSATLMLALLPGAAAA